MYQRLFCRFCLPAMLLIVGCSSPSSGGSGSTFGSTVPDYVVSGLTTNIDADVPGWIKDNFTNVRAYMDGDTVVIQTRSFPPYHTYYYGSTGTYSSLYDATTKPDVVNPNTIAERAVTLRVPKNPAISAATIDAQKSSAGLGVIGIAVNGVVLFNDDANTAAGDEIVNEVPTMDSLGGHPTQNGVYHYHIEPSVLIPSGGAKDELLGIAVDGLPIFGPKDSSGTPVFDAGGIDTAANTSNYRTQSNWIAASDQSSPPALYDGSPANGIPDVHYHVVTNFYLATTKVLPSVGTVKHPIGTIEPDFYMIGDWIAGTKGTVSDAVK